MHLHDVLGWSGPMTSRQFDAWQVWLADDLNVPDKTQHYLMRIAQRVEQGYSRHGVTLQEQKVEWSAAEGVEDGSWAELEDGTIIRPPGPLTEQDLIDEAKREVRRRDERSRSRKAGGQADR